MKVSIIIVTCWSACFVLALPTMVLPRDGGANQQTPQQQNSRASYLLTGGAIGAGVTGGVAYKLHRDKIKKLTRKMKKMDEESSMQRTHRILMECFLEKQGTISYDGSPEIIKKTLWELCRIKKGVPPTDLGYLLGPDVMPPQITEERRGTVLSAIKRMLQRAKKFGHNINRVLVTVGSAGGRSRKGFFKELTPTLGFPGAVRIRAVL